MDDLKLYGAIKDQLDSLIQVVRIFSDIPLTVEHTQDTPEWTFIDITVPADQK